MDKIDRKDRLESEKNLRKKGLPLLDKRLGKDRPDRGWDQPGSQQPTGKTPGKDRVDRTQTKGRVGKKRYNNIDRMDRIAGLIPFFV